MPLRDRSGFTLIELLIAVAIIAIIAAIAVPGLLRSRLAANEASAIASLRSINSSQHAYSSSCAQGAFASILTDLAIPPTPGGASFISTDLGVAAPSVVKSGYVIEMNGASDGMPGTLDACNGVVAASLVSSYYAFAQPASAGATGIRYFWTNTLGTIYFDVAFIADTVGTGPPATGTALQ